MFAGWAKKFAVDTLRGVFNPLGVPGYLIPGYANLLLSNKEMQCIMYHEAGHALANHLLDTNSRLLKISCKSAFGSSGRCIIYQNLENKEYVKACIVYLMAGSAAEKIFMGKDYKSLGTRGDIGKAKFLIMDVFGYISWHDVEEILQQAEDEAYELLSQNREKLDLLVSALTQERELEAAQVEALLGDRGYLTSRLSRA